MWGDVPSRVLNTGYRKRPRIRPNFTLHIGVRRVQNCFRRRHLTFHPSDFNFFNVQPCNSSQLTNPNSPLFDFCNLSALLFELCYMYFSNCKFSVHTCNYYVPLGKYKSDIFFLSLIRRFIMKKKLNLQMSKTN